MIVAMAAAADMHMMSPPQSLSTCVEDSKHVGQWIMIGLIHHCVLIKQTACMSDVM